WVLGRLKDGVSRAQAQTELSAIGKELSDAYSGGRVVRRIRLEPPGFAGGWLRGSILSFAGVLMAATALVLIVACLNIANLLLARASDRSKEFAMRMALGARRSQLVRQLLTESLVLAIVGGIGGCFLAYLAWPAISRV